jgi:hypothetical protein
LPIAGHPAKDNGSTMGTEQANPYTSLPPTAFWRPAVAERGIFALESLWSSPWTLPSDARFSTYGSCFAQHISRNLIARKLAWVDAEPAPGRTPPAVAKAFNYGVFSARTGNIYTAAQLLAWTRLATGQLGPDAIEMWQDDAGRVHDLLRPRIEPDGFASEAEARATLRTTARAFRRSFAEAEVFIFTLGLTEGWEDRTTGQVYALCPGTGAGRFDAERHVFRNYGFARITDDLRRALDLMWEVNPALKVILTVSPVPLVATASGNHVLVATTESKSVLRAVAGELAREDTRISYFPSYEIIASPPARAAFFEPNLRSVVPEGVELVMRHFFAGLDLSGAAIHPAAAPDPRIAATTEAMSREDLVCEEIVLDVSRHV